MSSTNNSEQRTWTLFTRVRGETVWKIAEGVSSALLRWQEAADRHSFDAFWPLS